MSVVISPATLDAAFLRFDTIFQRAFTETPTHWDQIATRLPSETEEERHAWMKRIPELRKWVGERRINNLSANLQAIRNETWEDTIGVPRTKIEDDRLGIFDPQVSELGRVTKIWPDRLVVDALTNGETALAHDGQPFFSASHPINPDDPASATQSNLFTGGNARPLSYQNFKLTRAAMRVFKGEDNLPLELSPPKWALIVPASLETEALQIAQQEWIAPTSNFGVGAQAVAQQNIFKGTIDVIVLPRLDATDTTSWYVADCSRAIKPLIFQDRMAPEFSYLNRPDDANVFMMDQLLMGVRARGAGGYGPYYLISKNKAT